MQGAVQSLQPLVWGAYLNPLEHVTIHRPHTSKT
jgi:hypothetical protein